MVPGVDSAGLQEGQEEFLAGWMTAGQHVQQGAAREGGAVPLSPFFQVPVGHSGPGTDLLQALGELLNGLGRGGVDVVLRAGHGPGIEARCPTVSGRLPTANSEHRYWRWTAQGSCW